jgi:hypothetical protein
LALEIFFTLIFNKVPTHPTIKDQDYMNRIILPQAQARKMRCVISVVQGNLDKGEWYDPYVQKLGGNPLLLELSECNTDEVVEDSSEKWPRVFHFNEMVVVVGGYDALLFQKGRIRPFDEIELDYQPIGEVVSMEDWLCEDELWITKTVHGYGQGVKIVKCWSREFFPGKRFPIEKMA